MTGTAHVAAGASLADLLAALDSGNDVMVGLAVDEPGAERVVERLGAALAIDGVASASPVPRTGLAAPHPYDLHAASPPAPTVALPCTHCCLLGASALASIDTTDLRSSRSVEEHLVRVGERLGQHGWRHVAAPGLALDWNPAASDGITPAAGWGPDAVAAIVGDANAGLEAHTSWAHAATGPTRLVIDGACLGAPPFTGTQHVVVEVARAMSRARPDSTVSVAVRPSHVETVRGHFTGTRVEVVARERDLDADVLYRPYQILFADDLAFIRAVGRRALVGQLDMIGFSNAGYHPSQHLFFFARNLQRLLMRTLDGVTFISQFGLESTYAECPDLDRDRLHVVSCGADPTPLDGVLAPSRPLDPNSRFLVSLSSTFRHKNRAHAVRTFARLVETTGYDGSLVIAGPEPYFGTSVDEEDVILSALDPAVAARVHRWGQIDEPEKWWLLRRADAVLYPSVIEGFGLVPFEAAAVGTPCLSFDGTAQAELLGGTLAVIGSWDVGDWASRIAAWIADRSIADEAVREVVVVGSQVTWDRCAERTWLAVDSALAAPRRATRHEDGNWLTLVDDIPRSTLLTRARFGVARGGPAVGRRARRLSTRVRNRR